jgi:hypothetical protein
MSLADQALSKDTASTLKVPHLGFDHWFYTGMSIALACMVFVGFAPSYFLKGIFGAPPLSPLMHIHGAVFTAWTLFYIFQNVLVTMGRTALHRRVGMAGAFIACAMVLFGVAVARASVRAGFLAGHDVGGLNEPPDILLVNSLTTLALFCVFFGAAVCQRRRKEIHKRLMLLSMTILMFPAIGRLHEEHRWIGLPFALAGLVHDGIFQRRLSFTYVWGALLIIASVPLRLMLADTPAWHRFLVWFVS